MDWPESGVFNGNIYYVLYLQILRFSLGQQICHWGMYGQEGLVCLMEQLLDDMPFSVLSDKILGKHTVNVCIVYT